MTLRHHNISERRCSDEMIMLMMMIFHVQLTSAMKLIPVKILKIFPASSYTVRYLHTLTCENQEYQINTLPCRLIISTTKGSKDIRLRIELLRRIFLIFL